VEKAALYLSMGEEGYRLRNEKEEEGAEPFEAAVEVSTVALHTALVEMQHRENRENRVRHT
jgi:hypothetical protein